MSDAASVFNSHAAHYEVARNRLIPPFEDFYGTAVEAINLAGPDVSRVIDLGGGTGMLTAMVRDAFPRAQVTLFDGASLMIEKAKEMYGEERITYVEGDLYGDLPPGPWDAVVSALAIHHLTDDGKKHVFESAFEFLRPGGIFVNAEHILGPTAQMDHEYRHWHEKCARHNGINDEEWHQAEDRMLADHLSPLAIQLEWLTEAGFEDVDILFKDHGFAVLFGRKAD
ncbi:MAG: class I SAM-dependent methyltransferase [Solirubrobacterales bacterium]|nr:class I SAM-dependent methyltransferase [Solirubrobacterales bacterium]